VIRRSARKRQTERHVHGAAERRNLDRGHADVVVRRDHRVEFAAYGAHKDCVSRKRPGDSRRSGRRRQQLGIFVAKTATITGMRIQRAQRDPRRGNAEPLLEALPGDARGFCDRVRGQSLDHLTEWEMCGGEDDSKLVRGKHHCHVWPGKS
jgi:hypothetical protein